MHVNGIEKNSKKIINLDSRNPIRLFVPSFRLSGAGTKPRTHRTGYPSRHVADLAVALLVHVSDSHKTTCLVFRSQTGGEVFLGARSLVLGV